MKLNFKILKTVFSMYKLCVFSVFLSVILLSSGNIANGQNAKKPDMKTYAYIRNAINYEKSAVNFNSLCAKQADKQGLKDIANTLLSISKSENEEYLKLKGIATSLGIEYTEKLMDYPVMSTVENLKRAKSMQDFEAKKCTEAIKVAKEENLTTAADCFKMNLDNITNFKTQITKLQSH